MRVKFEELLSVKGFLKSIDECDEDSSELIGMLALAVQEFGEGRGFMGNLSEDVFCRICEIFVNKTLTGVE